MTFIDGNILQGNAIKPQSSLATRKEEAITKTANDFETEFLTQMLSYADIGMPKGFSNDESFKNAFGSFFTRLWATSLQEDMNQRGNGLGLADKIAAELKHQHALSKPEGTTHD